MEMSLIQMTVINKLRLDGCQIRSQTVRRVERQEASLILSSH